MRAATKCCGPSLASIRNDHFARLMLRRFCATNSVTHPNALKIKPGERLPHCRMIVQRQNEAPFDLTQLIGHAGKFIPPKHTIPVVALAPEIGGIEIEQRPRSVIARDES